MAEALNGTFKTELIDRAFQPSTVLSAYGFRCRVGYAECAEVGDGQHSARSDGGPLGDPCPQMTMSSRWTWPAARIAASVHVILGSVALWRAGRGLARSRDRRRAERCQPHR